MTITMTASELPEVVVDNATRIVTIDGEAVKLSAIEFALVSKFASDPARVFSKQELYRSVWMGSDRENSRTVDTHICRLRPKFGPGFFGNVWGVGYRFTDVADAHRVSTRSPVRGMSGDGEASARVIARELRAMAARAEQLAEQVDRLSAA